MVRLVRWYKPVLLAAAGILGLTIFAIGGLFAYDALIGINNPYSARQIIDDGLAELGSEWLMHPIDNPGDWLPNGLSPADVNMDGYMDYLTNYEYRGRIRVAFHPGPGVGDARWAAVDAGEFPNAENAAFGDLDGDGKVDILVAHGIEHTDLSPGLRVLWGEWGDSVSVDASAYSWIDGGDIPASQGGWQFLDVQTIDLDLDGDLDLVAGGRATRMAGVRKDAVMNDNSLVWAGLRWFENPGAGQARKLNSWRIHSIDASTPSGHGFEFGDLDRDGDLDICNDNADWDTLEEEENLSWYENPGSGTALYTAWSRHEIYRGDEFYGKEQVAIADLDSDGDSDILTQTEKDIYWFKNTGKLRNGRVSFTQQVIPKHLAAQWRARPIEVFDVNGDGQLDIVGALIHRDGLLPRDKAAVFWMEREGDRWRTHVIKWGDGFLGLGTFNGEKWDQLYPVDIDNDGDLDLVANVEEYNRLRSILAVVWFENPTR